jgi:hypothetical protein
MITLATDIVQHTYWQIRDNQEALNISLKTLFINFLDDIVLEGKIYILDSGGQRGTTTHTLRPNSS